MTPRFCRDHRSHFCPCAQPDKYRDVAKAKAEWDAAEERYQEKKERKS